MKMPENNLGSLLKDLENFITTKTVIGEPIHIEDTILVPLVDVSFGIGAAGKSAEKVKDKNKEVERHVQGPVTANGGGVGARIAPSAILIVQNGTTQLINIKGQDSLSKLIDMVPGIMANLPSVLNQIKSKPAEPAETVVNLEK